MNSTMWPIFNKKVTEKWNLWIREKSNISAQKKKSWNAKCAFGKHQTHT